MPNPDQPSLDNIGKPEREVVRDKRRAEALRANLKRRKAQMRGRADHSPPSAGIPTAPKPGDDSR